jgi:pimeloyl-ACP methyl ester carboxylesterase
VRIGAPVVCRAVASTVVLVHGAWHGAWCWDKVVELLDARDVASVAIDLPGHGTNPEPLTDLRGDAAALSRLLDALGTDAVVCGHSYGGAVITEGAARPNVRHLVYLTAFQLQPGESCMNAAEGKLAPGEGTSKLAQALQSHEDGTFTIDPGLGAHAFYNDCSKEDIEFALPRLCPQLKASLAQAATRAAWHDIPSTYAVCTNDLGVAPALQRALASRADAIVEWPTSHSPFFSRPELVADVLAGLARD